MTLNEVLLILAGLTVLIIPTLILKRIRQPLNTYIKLTSGLFLLILVWFFADHNALPYKVIISTVVIAGAVKTIKDYKESGRSTETENS